jgi:FAD/FMN-containing dehydrogenase
VTTTCTPRSELELAEVLRSRPGRVRLRGSGSRQDRVGDPAGAMHIDLRGLDSIDRLDAPDLTCSVGAGMERHVLDEALHDRGVELPCAGAGTLGGLFAHDPIGAVTIGGGAPRSLLLGLVGLLADGTPFKSGARVVKSVAGFDVHKLLIGSDGRLFAATKLHLRLRPRPRAEAWFRCADLELSRALALFTQLRNLAVPPAALHLARTGGGCEVAGRITGRASHVATMLRTHDLTAGEPFTTWHVLAGSGETVTGIVLPSRVVALLASVPANAPFVLHGGGRFELALASPAATDAFLAAAPDVPAQACIVGGDAVRRGRGTPLDPGQRRVVAGLKQALDPDDVLV